MKQINYLLGLFFTFHVFFITTAQAQPGSNDPSFNPIDSVFGIGTGANNWINAIAIQSDGKIVIGGDFTRYHGAVRNRIVRINSNGSLDTGANQFVIGLGATGTISRIAIQSDGKILIAGGFTAYNGTTRNRIARINSNGSIDTSFNPGTGANDAIIEMAIQSDGKILIVGSFTRYNGTARNGIARINSNGSLDTGFNPGAMVATFSISKIAIQSDGKILIGGGFTTFNGTARNRIARINTDGSLDTGFDPGTGLDNFNYKFAIQSDGKILIGGAFTTYNGTARNRIVRINSNGSLDTGFDPGSGADGYVIDIGIQSDGKIVIGGDFSTYNGTTRTRIARINSNGSLDTGFNPGTGANLQINAVAIQSDGKILIGGRFTMYDGKDHANIARINSDGSLDAGFNKRGGADNTIHAMAIQSDGKIVIGGDFLTFNETTRTRIARINTDGSLDTGFDPGTGANNTINRIAIQSDGKILIMGLFTTYNGTTRNRIARINSDGSLDTLFDAGLTTSGMRDIAIQSDGKIVIVGSFTTYAYTVSYSRNRITRINSDGSFDSGFIPGTGANNQINAVAIQSDGKILIGGTFTTYNGTTRNRIARINTDGTLDTGFNPGTGANTTISTMAIQSDGKIVIGGIFTTYNGTTRNRIARINTDGTLDTLFNPGTGADANISAMAIQSDNKILIVGAFTTYNGTARIPIARINTDGSLDTGFDPGAGGAISTINAMAIQSDWKILIGGTFYAYNGATRTRIARILNNTLPKATLSAPGVTTTCLGGGIPLKVSTIDGTPPFTVWLKDNLGFQRTHIQTQADSTFTIFPQSNCTYTLDSVKDANGNKADPLAGSVAVTITASPVISSVGTTISRTLNHLDGYTLTYANGDSCKSWVKITDSVGGTNPGSTTCLAEVMASAPMNTTARGFVARRINIAPTTNGVARVTLFYTQAEFTAFNSIVTYQQKLPINSTDTAGMKSKITIRRTTGSIETASFTSFSPDSITWNANTSTWEVNFRVDDGVLGGNYYLSPQFTSTKMVTGLTHIASTPVSGATTASITVDWNDVVGVTQYRLRIRPVGGSWNASTITGSQRIMNLAFNTTYEVQARVYESQSVQGEYTTTYSFTTPQEGSKLPDCLPPSNLNVTTNSPVSATISWTSAFQGTNYIVEMRLLNSLVWGGTSTAGNSVTFPALTPGATYEYRIRTTCLEGYTQALTSPFSSIGTFSMPNVNTCGTVSNLNTVSITTTSATISWSPISFATAYQVQMRLKNTASWGGTTTTSTSFTFNSLSSSSIYEYRVRAFCNGVPVVTTTPTGLFSSVAEFTTASAPALAICLPPTNIVAVPSSNSVTVTWDSAANDMSYFINIKQANAVSWGGTTVNTLSRTFNALSPSTNYQIRIRTACTPGTTTAAVSVFSDTVLFTTTALANKAIFDNAGAATWQVYPNPTRDLVQLEFTSSVEAPITIMVFDITGRLVQSVATQTMQGNNQLDISLGALSNGMYIIKTRQGDAVTTLGKVTKN